MSDLSAPFVISRLAWSRSIVYFKSLWIPISLAVAIGVGASYPIDTVLSAALLEEGRAGPPQSLPLPAPFLMAFSLFAKFILVGVLYRIYCKELGRPSEARWVSWRMSRHERVFLAALILAPIAAGIASWFALSTVLMLTYLIYVIPFFSYLFVLLTPLIHVVLSVVLPVLMTSRLSLTLPLIVSGLTLEQSIRQSIVLTRGKTISLGVVVIVAQIPTFALGLGMDLYRPLVGKELVFAVGSVIYACTTSILYRMFIEEQAAGAAVALDRSSVV
jgi:hypothetical protein